MRTKRLQLVSSGPSRGQSPHRLVLAVAAWALLGGGCVSKSIYLQKVDEAVRHGAQADAYKRELTAAAEVRAKLNTALEAEERKVAVCELNQKAVREDRSRVEGERDALQARIKTAADDVNEVRAQLSTSKEQMHACENRVVGIRTAQAAERRKEPNLSDVAEALKAEVEGSNGGITLFRPKGAVQLRIPSRLFFRLRNARVSEEGKQLASRLADVLGRLRDRVVLVEGHEDKAPVPKRAGSPTELSLTQAYAVALFLVRAGMDSARVSVVGMGARRMLAAQEAPGAEDLNRRIEIVVTPAPVASDLEVIGPDAAPTPTPTAPAADPLRGAP